MSSRASKQETIPSEIILLGKGAQNIGKISRKAQQAQFLYKVKSDDLKLVSASLKNESALD